MSVIQPSPQAADRGEPSYVWRAGQQRRLEMIKSAAGERISGTVLENGCGIGLYIEHLQALGGEVIGLEFDLDRALQARQGNQHILGGAGEYLPFPEGSFDLILSNEVIEHVQNDRKAIQEMVRAVRVGGRIVLFCPNRWYPFETHGVHWRGRYHFGNIPLVNYLPGHFRNQLVPHVRAYTRKSLGALFEGLPVKYITRRVIFGGYDNIIHRAPRLGRMIRSILYALEKTPFHLVGLSHFWVVEKTKD